MLVTFDQPLLARLVENWLENVDRGLSKLTSDVGQRNAVVQSQAQEPGFLQRFRPRYGGDRTAVIVGDTGIQIGSEIVCGGNPDCFAKCSRQKRMRIQTEAEIWLTRPIF